MATFQIGVGGAGYVKQEDTEDGRIEVWVDTFHVEASTARGERWVLADFEAFDEATARAAFEALGDCTPATAPERWLQADPIYGSDAWDGDAERGLACFEADAYNEPRPQW